MQICFATNNPHKLREIQDLLGSKFQLVTLQEIGCNEELPEEQDSLSGNSLQKANYVFERHHIPCFADDSGLLVDVLNGAPGVFSARYAGPQRNSEDNMNRLLENLEGEINRTAQFKTSITFVTTGLIREFEGSVSGTILNEKRGTGGFGYDPIFLPDGFAQTFGEMDSHQKNAISHRAIAFRKLIDFLVPTSPVPAA